MRGGQEGPAARGVTASPTGGPRQGGLNPWPAGRVTERGVSRAAPRNGARGSNAGLAGGHDRTAPGRARAERGPKLPPRAAHARSRLKPGEIARAPRRRCRCVTAPQIGKGCEGRAPGQSPVRPPGDSGPLDGGTPLRPFSLPFRGAARGTPAPVAGPSPRRSRPPRGGGESLAGRGGAHRAGAHAQIFEPFD